MEEERCSFYWRVEQQQYYEL